MRERQRVTRKPGIPEAGVGVGHFPFGGLFFDRGNESYRLRNTLRLAFSSLRLAFAADIRFAMIHLPFGPSRR